MKFIFPAKVVSKVILNLVILFISFIAHSQVQSPNSVNITEVSEQILEKKIGFDWNGGSLSEALNKIAKEHHIKFSFANSRIENIKTASFGFQEIKLFDLLNQLFKNTGFNYTMVGRIIVVYKQEEINHTITENSDTTTTYTDTIVTKKYHPVYSANSADQISDYQRKIINKIYKREIKWAARYRKKQDKIARQDSVKSKPAKEYHLQKSQAFRYYLCNSATYKFNQILWEDNSEFPWREDLMWSSSWDNSLYLELQGGVQLKNLMFGTGMGIQKFSIKNSFIETIKKGKPKSPPAIIEFIPHTNQEDYIVFSIPLFILCKKKKKNWFLGMGGGGKVAFIERNKNTSQLLKKYYNQEAGAKTYSEDFKKTFSSLFAEVSIGYTFNSKFILSSGITYDHSLSSIYENSLYSPKVNATGVKIALYYQFNISRKTK